jgi:organic hydroperoxide reductase OsmC/OhrA
MQNLRVRVTAKYGREGSVLRGDARSFADSCHIEVSLDSTESAARLTQLIREAEASCFTIGAFRNPVPVDVVAAVNGEPFNLMAEA